MEQATEVFAASEELGFLELTGALGLADMCLAVSGRKGELLYASGTFRKLTGMAQDTEEAGFFSTPLGSEPLFKKQWRKAIKTGTDTQYGPIELKTGRDRRFVVGVIAPGNENHDSVVVSAHNVTHILDRQDRTESIDAYFMTLAGSIDSAVIVLDADSRVVAFNAQAEKLFGVSGEKTKGEKITVILPELAEYFVKVANLPQEEEPVLIAERVLQIGADKRLLVKIALSAVRRDGKTTGFICVLQDATEQSLADRDQRQRLESLEELRKVSAISGVLRSEEMLSAELAHISNLVSEGFAIAFKIDRSGSSLSLIDACGLSSEERDNIAVISLSDGTLRECLTQNAPRSYRNGDELVIQSELMALKPQALAVTPLKIANTPIGLLVLGSKSGMSFRPRFLEFFEAAGEIIGAALKNCWQFEEARESLEYYKILQESSSNLVLLLDKHGTIIDVSNQIKEMLGHSKSEILGTKFIDYVSPDSRQSAEEAFEQAFTSRQKTFSATLRASDGTVREILVLAKRVARNKRELLLMSCDDRSKQNRELQRRKALADVIIAATQDFSRKRLEGIESALERFFGPVEIAIESVLCEERLCLTTLMQGQDPNNESWSLGSELEDEVLFYPEAMKAEGVPEDLFGGTGVVSLAIVPVKHEGESFGALALGFKNQINWDDEKGFIEEIGSIISVEAARFLQDKAAKAESSRLRTLFSNAEAMFLITAEGVICEANQAACVTTGTEGDSDIIGRKLDELVCLKGGKSLLQHIQKNKSNSKILELEGSGSDNAYPALVSWVEWTTAPEGKNYIQVAIRQVGMEWAETLKAKQHAQSLMNIHDIVSRAGSSLDIKAVATEGLRKLAKTTAIGSAAIYIIDNTNDGWLYLVGNKESVEHDIAWPRRVKAATGDVGLAIAANQTRMSRDENGLTRLNLPLSCDGATWGAMSVEDSEAEKFDDESLLYFQTFADAIALSIRNALMHSELQKRLIEIDDLRRTDAYSARINSEVMNISGRWLQKQLARAKGQIQALLSGAMGTLSLEQSEVLQRAEASMGEISMMAHCLQDIAEHQPHDSKSGDEQTVLADVFSRVTDVLSSIVSGSEIKVDIVPQNLVANGDRNVIEKALSETLSSIILLNKGPAKMLLSACGKDSETEIEIKVEPFLPTEDIAGIFDEFNMVSPTLTAETKAALIGLIAAKGVIKANKGRLTSEPCPENQLLIKMRLPV